MRVLVDGRVGWGSGIGRVIAETVPRVAALMPAARFDLLVETRDAARALAAVGAPANLAVRPCEIAPFSPREQVALPSLAAPYDLTWFTNYFVPLRYPRPFVVTVHDMLHLNTTLFPAGRVKRALSRATFGKVRRDADTVMFDSRFTAREFERLVGPPRVGRVVHLGADHIGAPDPATAPIKERRLLVVAASKRHKNFATVLDAWAHARVGADWRLTIVSPKTALRSSIDIDAAAARSPQVDIVRGISDEELGALYRRSAILLMPSRYEGFGLPLLEAMRAHVWCISSTAPALVEVARRAFVQWVDGEDGPGWTAAIEGACDHFERDAAFFSPLLRHNRSEADRFTWARTAEQVADILGRHFPA